LGIQSAPRLVESPSNSSQIPNATVAGSLAVTKMRVESPMLNTLQPGQNNPSEITDQATWNRIAELYISDAKLDQNSIAVIRGKKFQSANPQKDGLARLVNNFETAIALDTVRNEYMLHRQIHQWFVQDNNQTSNLDALNEKVYAELFLTPSSDPWLGLAPDDVYSAIDNDGVKRRD
jgi:hypothetical protein